MWTNQQGHALLGFPLTQVYAEQNHFTPCSHKERDLYPIVCRERSKAIEVSGKNPKGLGCYNFTGADFQSLAGMARMPRVFLPV